MKIEFTREPRYVVLKISDIKQHLPQELIDKITEAGQMIAVGRALVGKPPFNAAVVEQDWPEFDLVWGMIEARMTGSGNDARRVVACVNACAGLRDDELECGVVPARNFIKARDQRDELLERLDGLLKNPNSGIYHNSARSTIAKVKGFPK